MQPASARSTAIVDTSTSLSLSPSLPTAGQQVTLTATVSTAGSGSPSGTVNFSDNGSSLGSASLSASGGNASTATLTTTLGSGAHSLTATYATRYDISSHNTFKTSTSSAVSFTIGSSAPTIHPTTTTLSVNPTNLRTGDTATLTATVAAADGDGAAPTGSVEFYDNGNDLGGATLNGSGVATLSSTGFISGTNAITATYAGDTNHSGSTSSAISVSATAPLTIHPTTISVTANPTSVQTGQTETFGATVRAADGDTAVPTGSVQFYDNGLPIGNSSVTLNGSGGASLTWTGFGAGTHVITAKYQGDTTHSVSTSSSVWVTAPAPPAAVATTITASISPNPIAAGGTATLSAHVEQVGTRLTPPQGSIVTFRNAADGSLIGQASLDGAGNGTVTKSGWKQGHYDITATYVGDANDASSSVGIAADVRTMTVLTVKAPSPTVTYGTTVSTLTPTYSGFVNGEDASSLTAQPTCSAGTAGVPAAGTYTVTCSGAVDPYYNFSYVSGTLTVKQAPLTVTPDDLTIGVGVPIPSLTATLSGFANGETLATSDVVGSPSCTTTATSSSPAGTYPITCTLGSLTSNDYSFTVAGQGTLTISGIGTTPTTVLDLVGGPIQIGEPVTLVGALFSSWRPLAGRTLTLSVGSASCTATTNVIGFGVCTVVPNGPSGPTTTTVAFSGDPTYAPASASRPAILFAFPAGGGGFVVGNDSAASSSSVMFWGSQWWKNNDVSDGNASHDFKGFASAPNAPSIGAAWSARSGDSASPPSGPLPAYMGVIVTDSTAKSGSSISGNIVDIVVVRTDGGYAPDPGHAGTGTIVAAIIPLVYVTHSGNDSGSSSDSGGSGSNQGGGDSGHGGSSQGGDSSSGGNGGYNAGSGQWGYDDSGWSSCDWRTAGSSFEAH